MRRPRPGAISAPCRSLTQASLRHVERKSANIIDALAEGMRAAGVKDMLDALEAKRSSLSEMLTDLGTPVIRLHPDIGRVYRERLPRLNRVLAAGSSFEALDAARALIDRIVVPPSPDGGPAGIELIGELRAMLGFAGIDLQGADRAMAGPDAMAVDATLGSVRAGAGGHCPLAGGV